MYGAGNIGRGFIGQLFSESGYEVCFVDVNEEIVNRLNADKSYPVNIVSDDGNFETVVKNVRAVNGRDEEAVANEIAACDIMATAVGVNVLKFIARPIAKGIAKRLDMKRLDRICTPLDIIVCENLIDADKYLRGLLLENLAQKYHAGFDKNVGLIEASIGRMVPVMRDEDKAGNPLRVAVEPYNILPVDGAAFKGKLPGVKNLVPYASFKLFIERKLFMHNMAHAAAAYFGALSGDEYIWQAIGRGEVRAIVFGAMCESARALAKEHGADLAALLDNAENLIYRFGNAALGDTAARVGRDPVRKLSYDDRLTGALRLCVKHGVYPGFIMAATAAALKFANADDPASLEVSGYCGEYGVTAALEKYAGLGQITNYKLQITNADDYSIYISDIEKLYKALNDRADLAKVIRIIDKNKNKEIKI